MGMKLQLGIIIVLYFRLSITKLLLFSLNMLSSSFSLVTRHSKLFSHWRTRSSSFKTALLIGSQEHRPGISLVHFFPGKNRWRMVVYNAKTVHMVTSYDAGGPHPVQISEFLSLQNYCASFREFQRWNLHLLTLYI
jgi:hypothetical protein